MGPAAKQTSSVWDVLTLTMVQMLRDALGTEPDIVTAMVVGQGKVGVGRVGGKNRHQLQVQH